MARDFRAVECQDITRIGRNRLVLFVKQAVNMFSIDRVGIIDIKVPKIIVIQSYKIQVVLIPRDCVVAKIESQVIEEGIVPGRSNQFDSGTNVCGYVISDNRIIEGAKYKADPVVTYVASDHRGGHPVWQTFGWKAYALTESADIKIHNGDVPLCTWIRPHTIRITSPADQSMTCSIKYDMRLV
jgi:hypothetical protein